MAKRKLIGAYIYQGETYGPGEEVEVPTDNERFNAVIDAGERREAQRLSERLASVGVDPTTMGLPEPQLSNTAPPDASPTTPADSGVITAQNEQPEADPSTTTAATGKSAKETKADSSASGTATS